MCMFTEPITCFMYTIKKEVDTYNVYDQFYITRRNEMCHISKMVWIAECLSNLFTEPTTYLEYTSKGKLRCITFPNSFIYHARK